MEITSKPKILYVDDEEENLLVFKSSFRRHYHILTAISGADALKILEKEEVDVVISDQRMPQLNGVQLLNSIPDNPPCVRMILTGYSDIETVITALNLGKINKYISKPWDKESLKKIIDEQLETLEARRKVVDSGKIGSKKSEMAVKKESSATTTNSDEVKRLQKELEDSYNYLLLLSEIGQEIIENKHIKAIIERTYAALNGLMDATVFACGLLNNERQVLEYTIMEDGEWLSGEIDLKDDEKAGVWTFKNKEEIFSNNWMADSVVYLKTTPTVVAGQAPDSMIYLPLLVHDQAIGVLTVQSFKRDAYTHYQLNIVKNMAIYVSTALENAIAYQQIELQKQEIEEKNTELEKKVELRTRELLQTNDEVRRQKDELESTYSKVQLLSEIGQQVTSTLSLETISQTVYSNVNKLMDATIFAIGIYDPTENQIDFLSSVEKGEILPAWHASLEEEDRIAVWCFNNKKEAIINDSATEYNKYLPSVGKPKAGESPESIIYLPLMLDDEPIGVITVQSFKKHVYNPYHIDILRSLAIYVSTAIRNAKSYQKMTRAFEQLKNTQSKLVESEKMASLGVLTAGVAHEINNPVNFISGGIISLKENYEDVEMLLKKYLSYNPTADKKTTEKLWNEIESLKEDIDLESLLPEIQDLFKSISNGASRSMEIVRGLKNFSRLDESDMKEANLETGIDSTLVILNNQLKNRITVNKEYGGIPSLHCFPGQLNQVFMNILNNAIQAMTGPGELSISTSHKDNNIIIRITDNGPGIPDAVKEHIFEPFYTTKGVGEGTGLGLSISYGIINKHKGTISVDSEMGKGTTFTITLPIKRWD